MRQLIEVRSRGADARSVGVATGVEKGCGTVEVVVAVLPQAGARSRGDGEAEVADAATAGAAFGVGVEANAVVVGSAALLKLVVLGGGQFG